jgi:transaldolase
MAVKGYFHRVHAETPTRFWINNPTLEQAREAIAAGAVGCTTNPSYVSKLFNSPDDYKAVTRAIDMLTPYESNDSVVAAKVQSAMVGRLSDEFLPLYRASQGSAGFVTIQGDPYEETIAQKIIDEGMENRKIGENVVIKIPVTVPGIQAIEYFVKADIPTMATEVMGLSQAVSICEAYEAASAKSGKKPVFYVTHITGILDDYFKKVVAEKKAAVSAEAMKYAGLAVAKREYALLKERKYPGRLMGGGARKLEDFTELVGGDLSITINWTGFADVLIAQDKPVASRIASEIDGKLIAELKAKLPGFSQAYEIDGMRSAEFYDYGGVELFRASFMKGWKELLALIAERRKVR